ncbi:MAG TPA: hypothetical protein PKH92_02700 [Anaerolineaceae bacterium]|nr:hypothetical protein [Anaerolineaceae bacterium]
MRRAFENSDDALCWFLESLRQRSIEPDQIKTIKVSAGQGKYVYQKQIWTKSREIYHIKFWSERWIPKASSRVSEFARPLDECLKFAIRCFGNGDPSASGLNESTLLELITLNSEGYETFLITQYKAGDVLWCRVDDLYGFVTQHGLLPQFSQTYGEPFCWIPTGWLKSFHSLISAFPEVIIE